ncbi:MAG TPA: TadE/TadG family type IV pilus assembly protein, partial [Gemmatales bacterium]|nr:TadE/TadG family type IV pilus assembly protein [Gemmatales bacterium]
FMLPFILLFLFCLLEYGRYVMTRNQIENAVREAARVASARTNEMTTADIVAIVQQYLDSFRVQIASPVITVYKCDPSNLNPLDADDNVVSVPLAPFNNAKFGQGICVRVQGTYHTIFGGVVLNPNTSVRLGSSFPVNTFSVMYSEGN